MKHKFKYAETIEDRKIYLIKCPKTKGKFSTRLWDMFKFPKNKCPCCGEEI